ncbi:hypothetical protein KQ945_01750 [Bacillus subtilis subsp. subtilis]|nr:hypothetical protein [Bacillus subtilis subsp. subtilis]
MQMRNTLILAALLATAPLAASAADGLSYTYVEGGWAGLQVHDSRVNDPELGGAYVRGSFAIAEQVHLLGGYSRVSDTLSINEASSKVVLKQPYLGVGYHMPMSNRIDFTSDITWLRRNAESTYRYTGYPTLRSSYHTNLGQATVGVRGKPSQRTEAWVKAGYLDGSDVEGQWVGQLGGQFNYTPRVGWVMQVDAYGRSFEYTTGLRLSF